MAPHACPICGSEAERTDRFRPTTLQRCPNCGLLFRGSVSEAAVHEMYSDNSYSKARMGILTRHRRRDARKRSEWTWEYAPGGRLLEVGAGAGFFVESAIEHGFDAIGIEPSDLAARYGRSELGMDVRTGFLETSEIPAGIFDVVCMWHVLEHAADPLGLLRAARARLAPRGRLLLEVPNIDSVGADMLRGSWAHLDPTAHVSHFAPRSLTTALGVAGFQVLHLSTLIEGYYDRPAMRVRPRRIVGRAVRSLRLRTLRLTHPDRGEQLRAVAKAAE